MDKYTKPPLTIDQQIQLLKDRNLVIHDDVFARRILSTIGYYRLTAYLYPFRLKDGSDNFVPHTSIEKVWRYYRFDRKMRFLLIDAIERIEVAVKAMVLSAFAKATAGQARRLHWATIVAPSVRLKEFFPLLLLAGLIYGWRTSVRLKEFASRHNCNPAPLAGLVFVAPTWHIWGYPM